MTAWNGLEGEVVDQRDSLTTRNGLEGEVVDRSRVAREAREAREARKARKAEEVVVAVAAVVAKEAQSTKEAAKDVAKEAQRASRKKTVTTKPGEKLGRRPRRARVGDRNQRLRPSPGPVCRKGSRLSRGLGLRPPVPVPAGPSRWCPRW